MVFKVIAMKRKLNGNSSKLLMPFTVWAPWCCGVANSSGQGHNCWTAGSAYFQDLYTRVGLCPHTEGEESTSTCRVLRVLLNH